MKTVVQLIRFLECDDVAVLSGETQRVMNLSLDSRQIQAKEGFIAVQGEQAHGLDFLKTVLQQRPAFIVSDQPLNPEQQALIELHQFKNVVVVKQIVSRLGDLADWFYNQPSQRLKVAGITGTNGKTSTAFYTAQLLDKLGKKVALMGTLGNGVFCATKGIQALTQTLNTTPDVVSVHRFFAEFIEQGVDCVIMEVSSHALELGRIQGVNFDAVALTQVTRDHMDFHGTLEAYQAAKMKLFTDYKARIKVLNACDDVGRRLIEGHHSDAGIWRYCVNALKPNDLTCDLRGENLTLTSHGMTLSLRGGENFQASISVPLMGAFNAENIMCALSIILASTDEALRADYWTQLKTYLPQLKAVEGRMQVIDRPKNAPTVIVDFAHTPDALKQVLLAIKAHVSDVSSGQLWVVFGCGGDRDQGKRPLMAQVAEVLANRVVVTSDNPRFESPEKIMVQIMAGFKAPKSVIVELDREKAIQQVLLQAKPNDVVLIAGKGHESYQDVKGVKTPFQDEKVVLGFRNDK